MKKWNRFFTIIFFVLIILPNICYIFVSEEANIENRTLSQKPLLSIKTMADFPQQYSEFYIDHIPFKKSLVQLYSFIKVRLLNVTPDDAVILGKNQWLFYNSRVKENNDVLADYCNTLQYTENEMKQYSIMLTQMKEDCEKLGADFYFMIAPNKENIYGTDYMPSKWKKAAQDSRTDLLVSYLNENTDINIIYPKSELLSNKAMGQLYFKSDTHWNKLGGYVGYQELHKAVSGDIGHYKDLVYTGFDSHSGDLAGFLQLLWRDTDYNISFNDHGLQTKNITDFKESGSIICGNTDLKNGRKLLMFRDSFTNAMLEFIASDYQESCFVWSPVYNGETVKTEAPDIVVYEIVERSIPQILRLNHKYIQPLYTETDIDNSQLDREADRISFAKEEVSISDNYLTLVGFTFLPDINSKEVSCELILEGPKKYTIPIVLKERPDVDRYYSNDESLYLYTGLRHVFNLNGVQEGEYQICIRLTYTNMQELYKTGEVIRIE